MPRAARLLLVLGALFIMAVLLLLVVPSLAQSDLELTATKIIADATQTSLAYGTPILPEIRMATMQAAQATRTAIAVTREPYLLTPQTPDAIELTATRIMANYELTATAYVTPNATELAGIYTTATLVAIGATQTEAALIENPSLTMTVNSSKTLASCEFNLINHYRTDLATQVQTSAPLWNTTVDVVTSGVGNQCGEFYPLETTFQFNVCVTDLSNRDSMIVRTMYIVQTLYENFPPEPSYGKVIRLEIYFANLPDYKYIDTSYTNAITAYAEQRGGIFGEHFIEALGGILDG